MRWVGPDAYVTRGPQGIWTGPGPYPVVLHTPRHSDRCIGLTAGGITVERASANLITGSPIESIDEMVERAVAEHGSGVVFTLIYGD